MRDALQKDYIVLTGNLRSPRDLKNGAGAQENLKKAINRINKGFERTITAKFMLIGGDSFQGMISSPKSLFDIYQMFFDILNHEFYLGIGIGGISTRISERVSEIDGGAFYRAREALEEIKKQKKWIEIKSEWDTNDIISSLLNFIADTMWGWTERQKEIVGYCRKMKKKKEDLTLTDVAERKNITKQNVSKILKRAKYGMIEGAERSFVEFVSRKWVKDLRKGD